MNHTSTIVILFIIIIIFIYIYTVRTTENYSSELDNAANSNYAAILLYLQSNPKQSVKFISDLKMKFFNDQCNVKSNIDFNNLAQLPYGPVFS